MNLSPSYYNLSSRIKLEELAPNKIAIVKRIKSRIIQKDALKIIEIAKQINVVDPGIEVCLICNNNICSKSVNLLSQNGLEVILVDN